MDRVGERLHRRHHDRVPGVDAERVHVLHRAHGDARVLGVAHDLVLDLLPAHEAALDHDLLDGTGPETGPDALPVRLLGLHDAATRAAQGERGADDGRQADGSQGLLRRGTACLVVRALHDERWRVRLPDPVQQVAERLAVLGHPDRLERRAEQAHAVPLQDAGLGQRHREVERRLATEARQQALGLLPGDDRLDRRHRERLEVDRVGDRRIGHDRRRVGVDEDRADTLGAQRAAGLGARVVELGRLADDDRPRAEDEHGRRPGAMGAQRRHRQGGRHERRGHLVGHRAVTGWRDRRPRTGRTRRARRAVPGRPRGGTGRSRSASPRAGAPRRIGRSGSAG